MEKKNQMRINFLRKFLKEDAKIGEVGVWKGDFSSLLLSNFLPKSLLLIDPWKFDSSKEKSWYGGSIAGNQNDMDLIFREVERRFLDFIKNGTVTIHRGSLEDADIHDLDAIYIDGDHSYDGVRKDINSVLRQMNVGTTVIFDDYGVTGWWNDGVTRAVREYLASGHLSLLDQHGTQIACALELNDFA